MIQEWPEEVYPPYADGPGYIISSDIANFIISDFEKHKLRVKLHYTLTISHSFVNSNKLHLVLKLMVSWCTVVQNGRC